MKIKGLRLRDVPKFIPGGNYQVDIHFCFLEKWMKSQQKICDMDPDFQRAHVWTKKQQTAYVEFLYRGGESSYNIHWNNPGFMTASYTGDLPESTVIVDGKQRMTAVLMWLHNEIPVFGHYLDEYEDAKLFTSTAGPRLRMYVNNLQTRKELLTWYLQLNEGGTPHTKVELQHVRDLLAEEITKERK